jgi:hypothetical protein
VLIEISVRRAFDTLLSAGSACVLEDIHATTTTSAATLVVILHTTCGPIVSSLFW